MQVVVSNVTISCNLINLDYLFTHDFLLKDCQVNI